MKTCTKCNRELSIDNFNKDSKNKNRLQTVCKDCMKIYQAAWYQANRAKKLEQGKQWRIDNKEHHSKQAKEYNKANKDKQAKVAKEWYNNNKEHRLELCRIWNSNNKDKRKIYSHVRRALVAGMPGSFTVEDIEQLKIAQNNICPFCGESISTTHEIDHIIPVSREGSSNFPSNLQLLCRTCNRQKQNKTNEEFLHYLKITDKAKYNTALNIKLEATKFQEAA